MTRRHGSQTRSNTDLARDSIAYALALERYLRPPGPGLPAGGVLPPSGVPDDWTRGSGRAFRTSRGLEAGDEDVCVVGSTGFVFAEGSFIPP